MRNFFPKNDINSVGFLKRNKLATKKIIRVGAPVNVRIFRTLSRSTILKFRLQKVDSRTTQSNFI